MTIPSKPIIIFDIMNDKTRHSNNIISKAREGFNRDLLAPDYGKIHYSDEHLELLLGMFEITEGRNYLDLGTGNGYLAFALASLNNKINVYGIDIADLAIKENIKKKTEENIRNVYFDIYNGIVIPYEADFFHMVMTRYALHHFPEINKTIYYLNKILEKDGLVLISDPVVDDEDGTNFMNKFMAIKKDGHVKCYSEKGLIRLFEEKGFKKIKSTSSTIRFPREHVPEYDELLKHTPEDIKKVYNVAAENGKIYITLKVMNVLFRKTNNYIYMEEY